MQSLPEEPKFVKTFTAVQKILAGLVVSIAIVLWFTSFDFFINIFKNGFLDLLNKVRVSLATAGALMAAFVGYKQIPLATKWILDNLEVYKKIKKELNKTEE